MDGLSLFADDSLLLQSHGAFGMDGYAGLLRSPSGTCKAMRTEDERKNKGKDFFFCDYPELGGGFDGFQADLRNLDPMFEIGSNYFDDTLWSSIFSPDAAARLVPTSSCFDSVNVSTTVRNDPLLQSPVPVPDDQINKAHPTNTQQQQEQQPRSNKIKDTELLCPPFDDMPSTGVCEALEAILLGSSNQDQPPRAPTAAASSSDATVPSSADDDLAAAPDHHAPRPAKKPFHGRSTPDMILEGMAENPLEMYFPPLPATAYEQQQQQAQVNGAAAAYQQFPEVVVNSAAEQPRPAVVLEAVPVKDLGFHKLQEGMNQMDVATKGRIRDALYRLANGVEQRHCAATTVGAVGSSSGPKRFKSSRLLTEPQTDPMDQSVAQLLLQKPPYRSAVLPHRVT